MPSGQIVVESVDENNRFAPVRNATVRFAPDRFMPVRFTPDMLAPSLYPKFAPI